MSMVKSITETSFPALYTFIGLLLAKDVKKCALIATKKLTFMAPFRISHCKGGFYLPKLALKVSSITFLR